MAPDGEFQVVSPSAGHAPTAGRSFEAERPESLYKSNAHAIVDVITAAIEEGALPTRVQGHMWDLCCSLGYLCCDCTRACTGKFQTILEEFGVQDYLPPPSSNASGGADHGLQRASSAPSPNLMGSGRGVRRKSLSQADVLRKQRQAMARFKKGTSSLRKGFASTRKMGGGFPGLLPPITGKTESDTSENDDWDVGEDDVQVAGDGDEMLAIIDEPFSPNVSPSNSPKKTREEATTVRLVMPTERLQAVDGPIQQCRTFGVVGESTGPLQYMEDRHVCLNADPFTVFKTGIGSEELAHIIRSPSEHNLVYEAFFGVIDGHGGERTAESLFIDLPKLLRQHPSYRSDVKQAIRDVCAEVDRRYVKQSVAVTMDQSGAVASFVLIRGSQIICASVGDCRTVLSRAGGIAVQLSHDHTLDNVAEYNRVAATDAKISRGRIFGDLVVTRSFGDARHKPLTCRKLLGNSMASDPTVEEFDYITAVPEIIVQDIKPDDEFLIMASDGLWDVFTSQNAVDFVRGHFEEVRHSDRTIRVEDITEACKKLIKSAHRKGSRDNVTVCIVCLWVETKDPNLFSSSDSESDSDSEDEGQVVEY